ncbi:hypothetical protein [Saccharothrix sp. ST-888]|uniref:hypothetical protein n=1 Tax=Saccharothrix sp. ST-888 TaxID=1427391 RepID=UPI0005ED058C|nr:hypothetical protein [Saccharothrix sp. ST-888]KJK55196.1 hypothetical protein UK12_30170 [Saccharothrix sp. ST-888]
MTDSDTQLDRLVDRAARGVLGPAEGPALRLAVQGLREELAQAQARITAVRAFATQAEPASPCRWHDHLCPFDVITELDALSPRN